MSSVISDTIHYQSAGQNTEKGEPQPPPPPQPPPEPPRGPDVFIEKGFPRPPEK